MAAVVTANILVQQWSIGVRLFLECGMATSCLQRFFLEFKQTCIGNAGDAAYLSPSASSLDPALFNSCVCVAGCADVGERTTAKRTIAKRTIAKRTTAKGTMALLLASGLLTGCSSTENSSHIAPPPSSVAPVAQNAVQPHDKPYQDLLAQYQSSLQVGAVLSAEDLLPAWQLYPQTSFYQPYSGRLYVDIQAMQTAMVKQQPELCLRLADLVLATHWLELEAHFAAAVCADELGQARKAAQHRALLALLVSQITQSGDGKSAATAYLVLSSAQARSYVQLNGFDVIEQALLHENKRFYDRLRIKSIKTGRELEVYFDVTWQMQWVAKRQDATS